MANKWKPLDRDYIRYVEELEKENTELKKQLAITREKIIGILKDYYFEDEEDIKLFEQMASKILGDDN